jgi:hypothetical protein
MKTLQAVLVVACCVLITHDEAKGIIGATGAGGPGALYRIRPHRPAGLIGPTNDVNGVNYSITGLAATQGGFPYHVFGATGGGAEGAQGMLVRIDPQTARVTPIGPFNAGPVDGDGNPATMSDLVFGPGGLYGVSSIGGPNLYRINTNTGQATLVGTGTNLPETSGGGLAVHINTFYGTPTADRFGTYNSVTGGFTNITDPPKLVGGNYTALDFWSSTGILYAINQGPGPEFPTRLVLINRTTGEIHNFGAQPDRLDALAILWSIPEPATLALWAIGLVAVASWRRRS